MQGPAYSRHYVRHVIQVLLQLLIVTAVALLTRLVLLEAHSLWLDEAISLETAARNSPADLWSFLRRWDMHPPLYYQLLDIWTTFLGTSLTALRVPSALAGTLTVPIYYVAVMQLSRRRTAFVAALLLALAPMQVEIGQEARMYALLTLWVCGALVCMVNLLRREAMDSARGFWLGLAVCLAGASYTHNTGGPFLAVALTLPVLAWRWMARRGHAFPQYPALNARGFTFNWVTALGLAFLMWLPWAPAFGAQSARIVGEFWIQPLTVETVAWTYLRLTGFNWLDAPVLQLAGFGFLLGLAGLGVWHLRRSPVIGFLLLGLFLVPPLMASAAEIVKPIWHIRSLNWIHLPLLMTAAVGICGLKAGPGVRPEPGNAWQRLSYRLKAPLQIAAILLLCAGQVAALAGYYRDGEREGWRDAAALIASRAGEGGAVLFHANWAQLPFAYHYATVEEYADVEGAPAIEQIPLPEPVFSGDVAEPKMFRVHLPYMHERLIGRERLFLVYSHDWYTDPERLIVRALEVRYRVAADWEFEAIRVIEYVSRDG